MAIYGLEGRYCPVCGKEFHPPNEEWAYKTKDAKVKYFCSWKCMRAHEKAKEEAEERAKWERSTRRKYK